MKLARMDWTPVVAIAIGTAIGVAVTGGLAVRASDTHVTVRVTPTATATVEVTPHLAVTPRVEAAPVVEVQPLVETTPVKGAGAALRVRTNNSLSLQPTGGVEPLIYVDGVRISDRAFMETLDPGTVDRIEIVKGGAAEDIFGPQATGGVIQIFLKKETGSGGS